MSYFLFFLMEHLNCFTIMEDKRFASIISQLKEKALEEGRRGILERNLAQLSIHETFFFKWPLHFWSQWMLFIG